MALIIYKVKSDYKGHALAPIDQSVLLDIKAFRLEPMEPTWKKPVFYVYDPVRSLETDFYHVRTGTIAFRQRVYKSALGEIIGRCGEILPANREDTREEFYILNPLACYNCLDREKAKLRQTPDGKIVAQVYNYAFHPDRIGGETLFKIPETYLTELFASSGIGAPSDEFFHQYHEGGFTGLKFEKAWSNEQDKGS